MNNADLSQSAYAYYEEFKAQILRQIDELNAIADGALQDGYNAWYLDDGWISLKGFSWGFVLQYDEPARLDMTFGPGWPFVGFRDSFIATQIGNAIAWVNEKNHDQVLFGAEQMARYGLRKLACKSGDEWIFASDLHPEVQRSTYVPVHHDSYRERP